jgi:hypothetical protein
VLIKSDGHGNSICKINLRNYNIIMIFFFLASIKY